MSNNTLTGKRLKLLFRQNVIHNAQFLLLATVAYIGLIFIVLCVAQVGNNLQPNELVQFRIFLVTFVIVFGILYVGHSFPAFRAKESTIHYLMIPTSTLEKFIFEFVNRIIISLIALPLLFWLTFNLQGYIFDVFSLKDFNFIGPQYLLKVYDDVPPDQRFVIYAFISGGVFFALSLAFTGAAMFTKQPLVKSLFAVALLVLIFVGYSYIIIEPMGLNRYHPPEDMILLPINAKHALITFTIALYVATAVMLFVAFRKLKEREV